MSSSLPPDPYKILGVSKDAQLPEIRSAHRKLVLKCHPDKVQDPTLKAQKQDEFQNVQQAYELLSDESERAKYDDNVKLAELRKEMASKGISVSANTSATRSAARSYDVNIRTAEPRSDTFKTSSSSHRPSAGAKMYSQSNSRSYDEDLYRTTPIFEEPRARRATSYEKTTYQKSSRSDEERERERDRERDRDRDRDRRRRKEEEEAALRRDRERAIAAEKEREKKALEKAAKRAAEDKEYRRRARKAEKEALEKAEKERDRERKQASAEKMRSRKPAYVEPYGADETYIAKDKKASKKTKEEEKRSRSIPREPTREEMPPPPPIPLDRIKKKTDETMMSAAEYMDKARRGVPPALNRAQTFAGFEPPTAPTPPVASSPFTVPPPPPIPTSDEDVRRSKSRRSSDTKREKSSHKKSPAKDSPYVVEASPTARPMPQFSSSHSSPMGGSPPKGLGRASTFDAQYVRPPPGPTRAQTFHYGIETDARGRNRSRLQSQQQTYSEESESEEDPRPRRSRHHDVPPLDYGRSTTKYAVSGSRTVPVVDPYYRDGSPTRKYESRPAATRESSAYSGAYAKVKTTARYAPEDIQYSTIPHRYRDPGYAY